MSNEKSVIKFSEQIKGALATLAKSSNAELSSFANEVNAFLIQFDDARPYGRSFKAERGGELFYSVQGWRTLDFKTNEIVCPVKELRFSEDETGFSVCLTARKQAVIKDGSWVTKKQKLMVDADGCATFDVTRENGNKSSELNFKISHNKVSKVKAVEVGETSEKSSVPTGIKEKG